MSMKIIARATLVAALLCAVALPARAETPDEIFSFATHLHKDGLLEAAAQQYLRFARENPTDPRAPRALSSAADCLADSDNSEQAVTVLQTILSTYPDHPEQCRYHVQLGRLLYKLEEYERADEVFTRVVVTMTDCVLVPDALLGKGESMISMKKYAAAAEVLENLLANHIESGAAPRASYDLAFCYVRTNRSDEALRTYEQIVERFPGDPLAGFSALEAARMHAARDEIDDAVKYYRRAREFGTRTFAIPAGMEGGDLLTATGRHREALQWYLELLARDDLDDPRTVHINAVEAAWYAGEYNMVRELAIRYEERYPGTFSPQISYRRALAALRTGSHDEALLVAARLEKFAAGTEWGRSASRIRGEAMLGKGRPQEAVDQFQHFVSVSGDSAAKCDVLRNISEISFTMTMDTTAALAALDRLLDVERRRIPGDMLQVGNIKERAGRNEEARRVYDDLLRRFPLSDESEQAQRRLDYLDEFALTADAAREMSRAAQEIATGPQNEAMLRLLDARIHVMKDFEGALATCKQLKKSEKGKPAYPEVLYYEGLCHAKLSRRAMGAASGNEEKRARDYAKKAGDSWGELIEKYPNAKSTPTASFELVMLRARIDGALDVPTARSVIARYPQHPQSARLMEMIGDQFYAQRGKENLVQAATYFESALRLDKNNRTLQLKHAMTLARQGKDKDALKVFERIARTDDSRVALKASYEAGRSLRELRRYRDALPYFDRVAKSDPGGAFGESAALQAADCVYLQKNYETALERYEDAYRQARTEKRRWETSHRMAMCLRQLGRYEDALNRLMDCILSQEGSEQQRARAYEDAAEVARLMGRRDAEVTILEAYLEEAGQGEGVDAASRRLVRLYLRQGNADAAEALARRVIETAPADDPEPRALLAMALYRQGKPDDARRRRNEVVKMTGEDSDLVREIGVEAARHEYDNREFKAAAASIRPYADTCKGEGLCEEARYIYAMSLLAAGELDRGASVAQSFFRDYPVSPAAPELHLRLGTVLATSNRTSESLLHFDEAARTASDEEVAYLALKNLGVSYQKLKRWREAEQVWQRVLQRFPDTDYTGEAALNAARCRMEQGDYRGAIAAYNDALPLLDSEAKARAFYWMGTSYEQLGDYQSAVVEYLKVPYLASGGGMWVVTAQLKAAECYVKIERNDAAREIYNKVIRAHGANSNWGKIAQKGLDQIGETAQSGAGGGER